MKKSRKPQTPERPKKKRANNRLRECHIVEEASAKVNREKALRMKVLGMSNVAIGQALGVAESTVRHYIEHELSHVSPQTAREREQMRHIACQRVETAINEAMHILVDRELEIETVIPGERGDKTITVERFKAVVDCSDVIIKGTARLAALYGLDATKETKVSGRIDGTLTVVSQEELDATTQARMAILRNAQAQLVAVPAINRG